MRYRRRFRWRSDLTEMPSDPRATPSQIEISTGIRVGPIEIAYLFRFIPVNLLKTETYNTHTIFMSLLKTSII